MPTMKTVRNNAALRAGRNDWYRIVNLASGAEVSIFDEIGYFGVTAQDLIHELDGIRGPIVLRLNSPGGEVFDGIAIYNALRARGDVSIRIEGLAASIASVIAMAADPGKLLIGKRASMMVHDGFSQAIGNAADMRALADLLDQQSDNIAGIYADRTGKTTEYWRGEMKTERWYTGEQAVAAGLADSVFDGTATVNAEWDLSVFRNAPGRSIAAKADYAKAKAALLAAGFSEQDSAGMLVAETDNGGWVMRGSDWVFDPDGDGDDDATPGGDTDHDYFDAEGKQIKAIPDRPGHPGTGKPMPASNVVAPVIQNADVDGSSWDASKAWHAGAAASDPAAFYRAICAGRKSGDPSTQAAWALPYKYSPSSPPNAAGVKAALGRLSSTQGLTNAEQAKSTLEGLMKKINPDYEPSNVDGHVLQSLFVSALEGSTK